MTTTRVVCWNLEKRDLVPYALNTFGADIGLFQEYNASFAMPGIEEYSRVEALSFDTYGTSVFYRNSRFPRLVERIAVNSPHGDFRPRFWRGLVYKTSAIAVFDSLIVVSFHGYNGTLQGRRPRKLADHVEAVLNALGPYLTDRRRPVVFAGDFNTFTTEHHDAVEAVLVNHGFRKAIEVRYDRFKTLDLVFTRDCDANRVASDWHESDHPYLVFDVVTPGQ